MKSNIYLTGLVAVQQTAQRGRGVFALQAMPAGLLLETAPVIVMSKEEQALLDKTRLHDYIFLWGEAEDRCCMALGYVPLYNHSAKANCEYVMDFKAETISIITVRKIKKGAELFINYNGDWNSDKPVWFETHP